MLPCVVTGCGVWSFQIELLLQVHPIPSGIDATVSGQPALNFQSELTAETLARTRIDHVVSTAFARHRYDVTFIGACKSRLAYNDTRDVSSKMGMIFKPWIRGR